MRELIKLLNEGWRVKKGDYMQKGGCIVELKKVEYFEETSEISYITAYVIEDENGKIKVIVGNEI